MLDMSPPDLATMLYTPGPRHSFFTSECRLPVAPLVRFATNWAFGTRAREGPSRAALKRAAPVAFRLVRMQLNMMVLSFTWGTRQYVEVEEEDEDDEDEDSDEEELVLEELVGARQGVP